MPGDVALGVVAMDSFENTCAAPKMKAAGGTDVARCTVAALLRGRFGRVSAVVVALVAASAGMARAQDFTATIPAKYTVACDLDRSDLVARVIARNPEVYPRRVAQTPGGWLVYDRYERQVVELDKNLRRVRSWGRHGPGPMEYEDPAGLGWLDSTRMVVVDEKPPSLIVFGPGGSEHRLALAGLPRHAIVADGRVLIATTEATVHEVTLDGQVRTVNIRDDFGLPDNRGAGTHAAPRLRGNHMAFTGPSAIWRLGTQPQRIIQRCVHDDLANMLEEAVRIDTPFGPQPFNLTTLQDFLPLGANGFLSLGGLVVRVNDQKLRSIEHYDSGGRLKQAWQLTGYPTVSGVFDEHVIGRMLIWDEDTIDGIQLVEVEGLGVNR